ncbi:MAG: rRNA pseudouridine synthase [Ignavibacteriales bacterium]|nr:rRNA pseudouridine synthase [Ignavibacteriales bacterium]
MKTHRVSLPRALSKLGVISRSGAFNEISQGTVTVNGKTELNPNRWVDLEKDKITFHGKALVEKPPRYIVFHKPVGVVTTSSDERGRQTIFHVLGDKALGLLAVGRLDKDTSGLLIMTNDHRLADFLTKPSSGVEKTYLVHVGWPLQRKDLDALERGVEIIVEGKRYTPLPAKVRLVAPTTVEISITEGKNRQIRKMIEAVGYNVIGLKRISLGPINLGMLKEGKSRNLLPDEIEALRGLSKSRRTPRRNHPPTRRAVS